jgi:GT2 family glycosyltransferase
MSHRSTDDHAAAGGAGGEPEITVVVVTHRGARMLPACLDGLAAQTVPHRLLVIDNDSTDGTAVLLAQRLRADQVVRLPRNEGFAGGVAAAFDLVSTRFVALLNDDAVPAPSWLERLLEVARTDRVAAAWTSLLVFADRPTVVNNAGVGLDRLDYGIDLDAGRPVADVGTVVRDVFGFSGGAVLLRADAVRAVGGFPAQFFLYYEDLDTSWRLRLGGWQVRLVPASTVRHEHSATSDPRSRLFHFHNERNRLWTLLRCAPWSVVAAAAGRFVLTTGSLLVKKVVRRPAPAEANLRVALRMQVLAATARALPELMRQRGGVSGRATRSRRETMQQARTGVITACAPDGIDGVVRSV